jgi:hypothetical protein
MKHLDVGCNRWHAMVNVSMAKNSYMILGRLRIGRAITI